MRRRLVLTIAACQIALGGVAAAETLPCKQDPRIIQQCFAVHGRLSVHANMRPYLWPIGTNRLLGVASPDGAIIMPPELERLFAARIERQVFGHFEVCPFTRRRPGIMQMVCIAGVTNLTVRDGCSLPRSLRRTATQFSPKGRLIERRGESHRRT